MEPAYWSRLTISFGPEGELMGSPVPGPVNDTTDPDLARLLRDGVRPVVESLLTPDELESVIVYREADETWVQLTARGEHFRTTLDDGSPEMASAQLADHLADWICETRFAWGEQRRPGGHA